MDRKILPIADDLSYDGMASALVNLNIFGRLMNITDSGDSDTALQRMRQLETDIRSENRKLILKK